MVNPNLLEEREQGAQNGAIRGSLARRTHLEHKPHAEPAVLDCELARSARPFGERDHRARAQPVFRLPGARQAVRAERDVGRAGVGHLDHERRLGYRADPNDARALRRVAGRGKRVLEGVGERERELRLAVDLLLNLPALLELLVLSESAFAPSISASSLLFLAQLASIASFAVMVLSGMFAKYLYRRSAAGRIRRIEAEFPEKAKREAVLRAQGGVSWAAVVGVCTLMMVAGAVFSLLLGPNVDAIVGLLI